MSGVPGEHARGQAGAGRGDHVHVAGAGECASAEHDLAADTRRDGVRGRSPRQHVYRTGRDVDSPYPGGVARRGPAADDETLSIGRPVQAHDTHLDTRDLSPPAAQAFGDDDAGGIPVRGREREREASAVTRPGGVAGDVARGVEDRLRRRDEPASGNVECCEPQPRCLRRLEVIHPVDGSPGPAHAGAGVLHESRRVNDSAIRQGNRPLAGDVATRAVKQHAAAGGPSE